MNNPAECFVKSYSDIESEKIRSFFTIHAETRGGYFCSSAQEAFEQLCHIYDEHVRGISELLSHNDSIIEDLLAFNNSTYPFLGFYVDHEHLNHEIESQSYGFVCEPGFYGTTITRPDLFQHYIIEQIQAMIDHHRALPFVAHSNRPIPIPFLREDVLLNIKDFSRLRSLMSLPCLRDIDDQIANGTYKWSESRIKPLSLFTAERVDYSLGRLEHYCGTDVQYFQKFILLTNYQRYVNLFSDYAQEMLSNPETGYTHWVEPQNNVFDAPFEKSQDSQESLGFQMPAYHLMRENNMGITLVNIGVGTSNAKNITDHLAVLRPHCWIMLGHCAGLRHDQVLGDYVLARGYVRNDHVMDDDLPTWIPVPALPEVETPLWEAVQNVTQMSHDEMKKRVRSGTVISTGNRNWELRIKELANSLHMSRSIALDMESATLAANGFRFRIPYGSLLCVSDRPIHGELKLQGMAKAFYQKRVKQHLEIGILALEKMRKNMSASFHPLQLRGLQDPPFR